MQLDLELYREETQVEPGITISYIDVAPERPLRTFVLLHGFGGNATQWQYQIETLSQYNRVLAIDLRGHGQSSKPESGYEMDRLAADVIAVLDHLYLHFKVVLVGHSFGVALATELAYRCPKRFSHLILIAGAGEYKIRGIYRLAFRLPEPVLTFAQPLVDGFADASLPALKQLYRRNMRDWSGWDLFPQLQMPVLVILGNKDQVLSQEAYERVAELVPPGSSEVISVDVSAHMVMLERRDAVNRAIARFVESAPVDQQPARWRTRFESDSRGSLLRERPWLAYYETQVPATIHVPDHPLTRLLTRAARRFPRHTAVISPGVELTYSDLLDQSRRFANALRSLDLQKGARIMLLLPNIPQLIIAYYGALSVGAIVVMGNPQAAEGEIIRQNQQTESEILVTWAANAALAAAVREQTSVRHIIFAASTDYQPWYRRLWMHLKGSDNLPRDAVALQSSSDYGWRKLLRRQSAGPLDADIAAGDTAVIQYTSGTSGPPKGVMLTHKNLLANTLQIRSWLTDAQDGQEIFLSVTPITHIDGMTNVMNVPISQGAAMVLLPRFSADEVLEAIKKYEPSYFPAVPAMITVLNNYPNVRKYNVESIRACLSSGAPLPIEIEEAFEKLTKARLVESYGLTEASPFTHITPLYGRDKVGSMGLPLPSTEARIVDMQTRRPLLPGQIGELAVRGPQVMLGYWQDKEATEAAIDELGWLYTGDIARMDEDGFFQIISRSHEMWHSENGADIYPRDIEEILYELPAIAEVTVAIMAGRPVAFVRRKDNAQITAATIVAYCQRRLPPAHVPRRVIFVSSFPRTLIGKVLRRELVDQFENQLKVEPSGAGQHLPLLDPAPLPVK